MRIIKGFQSAREALSRGVSSASFVSPPGRPGTPMPSDVDDPIKVVGQIIDGVRQRGDEALREYTLRFDGVEVTSLEVGREQIDRAYKEIDPELLSALKLAAERIGSFHQKQKDGIWAGVAGMDGRQLVRPLERVGIYVPGGRAFYPSTVLMTAIPARVAGVKEIFLATPPGDKGLVPAPTLAAAAVTGVDRVFCIGGAQAVAALALGTESVPRVDKICGPGNIFVTLAKKLVYGMVDIDGLQGPSEVFIIADETADAGYCAADLLAQAEHDPMAASILVTCSSQLADEVSRQVAQQLTALRRRDIAERSLSSGGIIAIVADIDEAIELANLYAPEHLCLLIDKAESYIERIINAGCILSGEKATVVLGDYIAGPSHVLPTGGTARFSSPLNINDFIKFIDVVTVDDADLKKLGPAAITIARAEGLEAHARAVEKRLR